MDRVSIKILFGILILSGTAASQTQHTIMTYNILNYPFTDTTSRNPYFRTIFQNIQPDILVVQEIVSQASVDSFLSKILNSSSSGYAAGTFINGPDLDRAIFYKSSLFTFISNTPIATPLRDINEFKLVHNSTNDTLRIYAVHLKANDTSADSLQRAEEVDSLRKRTNSLPPNSNFIVLGDFNIYSANEAAYQKLLNQSQPGYFRDPFNLPGTWNNGAYALHHTQSTRTRSFNDGATGGLDDRFDMILMSQSIMNSGGITFVPGTYLAYGNDGNHFNDSINQPPNTAVGQQIADALHYASDHLPVIAAFSFDSQSVQLSVTTLIEGFYNGSSMVQDTITVELRESVSPFTLVDEAKVFLSNSGNGTATFYNAENNTPYYIAVKHRNTIETWSAVPQTFINSNLTYDFTTASSKAFGNNMKLAGTKWCLYSGDVNQDGVVNQIDLNTVYASNVSGAVGYLNTDITGDSYCEIKDLSIVFINYISGVESNKPTVSELLFKPK
ncbi:MAG: endonuclease/exonuclease/phosphatase family protein [Ignavibacteriales bacterium]|nr:MAG: endonuclease/exonuclease/phosphatase family protein [Ignavibacteriales bacterium]